MSNAYVYRQVTTNMTSIKYLNDLHHNRTQKELQTFYFGYFGHVWLLPSKMIKPSCRNFDVYLHAKNELHS